MKIIAVVALLFCGGAFAREGPQCQAPNGAGLASTIKELIAIIPTDEVLELLFTAMITDPETQAVIEYLASPEFHQLIKAIQKEKIFTDFVDYACAELYLDINYYLNILFDILGFPDTRSVRSARGGVQKLVKKILALLPMEEMKALVKEKFATDNYFQLTVQKINSDEFGNILETIRGNVAFSDMTNRLRGFGLDFDLVVNTVVKIFHP